jgi:hypothetical protein
LSNDKNTEDDKARGEPVPRRVDLFKLFTPVEWIYNNDKQNNPDRQFVGLLAKQSILKKYVIFFCNSIKQYKKS